ncbi:hypothetical protein Tco_0064499 [Tanacetum coccineum]
MSSPKFAKTHNVVAFFEKPVESDGFAKIIDVLKASSVHYALTVNPIIYTSCIEQFWATTKVQTVNRVRQLQALVDKKRVIVTESSIKRDLHLDDAEGTDCLPTATIFEELARMGAKSTAWNEFSCSMASLIICLATNQKFNLSKYIFDAMVKHLDGGVKFLMYPRFLQVFINQQLGDMSTHKKIFVNPFHTKKVFANMKRVGKDFSWRITPLFATMMVQASEEVGEDSAYLTDSTQVTEVSQDETEHEESVPTPSNDLQPSGNDLTCQAMEYELNALKKRIQRLERKKMSKTYRLHPNRRRSILTVLMPDVDVSLVDETKKERQNDDFNSKKPDDEAVTTASINDSVVPTTNEEITMAQILIQIKVAKPKVVTTAATQHQHYKTKDLEGGPRKDGKKVRRGVNSLKVAKKKMLGRKIRAEIENRKNESSKKLKVEAMNKSPRKVVEDNEVS